MGIFVDDREDMRQIINGLQSHGKRVVFTNGVFDLLHVGHVRSLRDARKRGEFLIVAVNTDKSVRELKGAHLPVNSLRERVEVLCALEAVDYVTVLEENTADSLLEFLRPNIHAKGTDYTEETVPERETVLAYGGTIEIVGDPKKHSTTGLLEKIGQILKKKDKARGQKKAKKLAGKGAKKTVRRVKTASKKTKKKVKKKVTKKVKKKVKKIAKTLSKKKTGKAGSKKATARKGGKTKTGSRSTPAKKKTKRQSAAAKKRPVKGASRPKVKKKTGREKALGAY